MYQNTSYHLLTATKTDLATNWVEYYNVLRDPQFSSAVARYADATEFHRQLFQSLSAIKLLAELKAFLESWLAVVNLGAFTFRDTKSDTLQKFQTVSKLQNTINSINRHHSRIAPIFAFIFDPRYANQEYTLKDAVQGRTIINIGSSDYAAHRVTIEDSLSDVQKTECFKTYLRSSGITHDPFMSLLLNYGSQEAIGGALAGGFANLMLAQNIQFRYQGDKSVIHIVQTANGLKFTYEMLCRPSDRWLVEPPLPDPDVSVFAAAMSEAPLDEHPLFFEIKLRLSCLIQQPAADVATRRFVNCEYDLEIARYETPEFSKDFCDDLLRCVVHSIEFVIDHPAIISLPEHDPQRGLLKAQLPTRRLDTRVNPRIGLVAALPPPTVKPPPRPLSGLGSMLGRMPGAVSAPAQARLLQAQGIANLTAATAGLLSKPHIRALNVSNPDITTIKQQILEHDHFQMRMNKLYFPEYLFYALLEIQDFDAFKVLLFLITTETKSNILARLEVVEQQWIQEQLKVWSEQLASFAARAKFPISATAR